MFEEQKYFYFPICQHFWRNPKSVEALKLETKWNEVTAIYIIDNFSSMCLSHVPPTVRFKCCFKSYCQPFFRLGFTRAPLKC